MVIVALVVVVILGYHFNWDWAGLGSYSPPLKENNFQRGKTLWDWLQLLIIPVVLAVGGYVFNYTASRNEQKSTQLRDQTERDIAADNQRENALQAYLDKLSELLLVNDLRESTEDAEVRKIARVRTLTVLRRLDAERKGSVLKFLHEAILIDKNKRIIDLNEANLREADLYRAGLSGAGLSGAYLGGAGLGGAGLSGADLGGAGLSGADLSGAKLIYAKLRGANLFFANLSGANLSEADLSGANLYEALQLHLFGSNLP